MHELFSSVDPHVMVHSLFLFRFGSKLIIDGEMTGGSMLIVSRVHDRVNLVVTCRALNDLYAEVMC